MSKNLELKLKTCHQRKEPVEFKLLSSAKLRAQGCRELTAYDNEPRELNGDEFIR